MEDSESIAGPVKLVAGVAGEVEAEIAVVVKHWGVDGAVEKGKDSVRCRRDYGRLNVRHNEVVVRLKNGAGGHGWVVHNHRFLVVVDGLDLVASRRCQEEEVIVGAVEHVPELWCAAAVVDPERVVYGDVAAAGVAARGEREGIGQVDQHYYYCINC